MDRPVRWWVIMLIGGVGGGRRAREHTLTMARRADAASNQPSRCWPEIGDEIEAPGSHGIHGSAAPF